MSRMNRRQFIANTMALGLGASSFAPALAGLQAAQAAETSGYKALVCIFLLGGMDHADTILPYDTPSYNALANIRPEQFQAHGAGSGTSSRDRENLLPLSPAGGNNFGSRRYALTQQMSGMKTMFDEGDLAIVGGVGPLVEPVTREAFEAETASLPPNLFSHNDQQSIWQTFGPEGTIFGWGGLFLDQVLRSNPANDPRFSLITTAQNATFLSGRDASPFAITPFSNLGLDIINREYILGFGNGRDQTRTAMNRYFERRNFAAKNVFQRDYGNLQGKNIAAANDFADLFQGAGIDVEFPNTRLGRQLNAIARIISLNDDLNINRQIFYATQGGFDTHDGQAQQLPQLHSQISEALVAFRAAMTEIGMWDDVTLFTASDFGRTLGDNGDGTDHGWGGHHFVAGGAVRGNRIYGDMPTSNLDGDEYTPSRGRLIPSTSVDQYAATLGSWFGLSNAELNTVLPNLNNFSTRNLGFMDSSQTQQVASITRQVPATQGPPLTSSPTQEASTVSSPSAREPLAGTRESDLRERLRRGRAHRANRENGRREIFRREEF